MKYTTRKETETEKLGEKLAAKLQGREVVLLSGELGSGKTAFARGLIQHFLPGIRVLSPTFIIVRHYKPENYKIKNIYHLDLYRISSEKEVKSVGFAEYLFKPSTITVVEWPELLDISVKDNVIKVLFEKKGNGERIIEIRTHSKISYTKSLRIFEQDSRR